MVAPPTGRSPLSVGAGLDMKQLAETPRGSAPPPRHPGRERCGRGSQTWGPEAGVCPGQRGRGGREGAMSPRAVGRAEGVQ